MSKMLSEAERRIQVSCRGKEKARVMAVTDDWHAVLLFVPRQQSQGFLELAKQRAKQPGHCCNPDRTVCCLPVCLPKCDLSTWTHTVAHGDG